MLKSFTEQSYRKFFAIFLLAYSVIVFYLAAVPAGLWWDEAVYLSLAENLISKGEYSIDAHSFYSDRLHAFDISTVDEAYRPPLFPFLLASAWKISGQSEIVAKFLSAIFTVAGVVVVYFLGRKFSEKFAFFASITMASFPFLVFFGVKALTESLFIFLSLLFFYFYFDAIRGRQKSFVLSAIFLTLAFLTRYIGLAYVPIYLLIPLLDKKLRKNYSNRFFWLGTAVGLMILLPWLYNNYLLYSSPAQPVFAEIDLAHINPAYLSPWYFYLAKWPMIFGALGFFALPAIHFAIKSRKEIFPKIFLFLFVFILVAFSIFARKEERYLTDFAPVFSMFFAFGIENVLKNFRNKIILLATILIAAVTIVLAFSQVLFFSQNATAINSAGIFLREKVPSESFVLTNDLPFVAYSAKANTVHFPEEREKFGEILTAYNVSYIVIHVDEPSYPQWVWTENRPSKIFDEFELQKTFSEKGSTRVWVYKVGRK